MNKIVPLEGFSGNFSPLNFTIKTFATEEDLLASTALENTIGVVTTTPIVNYYFQSSTPATLAEGELWFYTGNHRDAIKINALKNHNLELYPILARQMESGVLVIKPTYVYQNGIWNNIDVLKYLYKAGKGKIVTFYTKKESEASISVNNYRIYGNYNVEAGGCWYFYTTTTSNVKNKNEVVIRAKCMKELPSDEEGYDLWRPRFMLLTTRPTEMYPPEDLDIWPVAQTTLIPDSQEREYVLQVPYTNTNYCVGYFGVGEVEVYDIYAR